MNLNTDNHRKEDKTSKKRRKTKICSIGTCQSPFDASYHRFPKDAKIQNAWMRICLKYRKDKPNISTARICGKHFTQDDFWTENKKDGAMRMRLKANAIPSINFSRILKPKEPTKRQLRAERRQGQTASFPTHPTSFSAALSSSTTTGTMIKESIPMPTLTTTCTVEAQSSSTPSPTCTAKTKSSGTAKAGNSSTFDLSDDFFTPWIDVTEKGPKDAGGLSLTTRDAFTNTDRITKQDQQTECYLLSASGVEFEKQKNEKLKARLRVEKRKVTSLRRTIKRLQSKKHQEEVVKNALKYSHSEAQIKKTLNPALKYVHYSDQDMSEAVAMRSMDKKLFEHLRKNDNNLVLPSISTQKKWLKRNSIASPSVKLSSPSEKTTPIVQKKPKPEPKSVKLNPTNLIKQIVKDKPEEIRNEDLTIGQTVIEVKVSNYNLT